MKKIVNQKPIEGSVTTTFLKNFFITSFGIFATITTSIFFLGSFNNKITQNEQDITEIKNEVKTMKTEIVNDIVKINELNNNLIDNKIYIYMNYNEDDKIDKLLKITDQNYNTELNNILKK